MFSTQQKCDPKYESSHVSVLRVAWLLLATCHVPGTRAGLRDEVKARAGEGVTLRCAVNKVTGILCTGDMEMS